MERDTPVKAGSRRKGTDPLHPDRTTRGKLHLVKCDRCRCDKQKCTPVERSWPTKCDRCVKKGFPCSVGKRVERKSKFTTLVATSLRAHPPQSNGDRDAETEIDSLIFLVGFHQIVVIAVEQYQRLEDKTLRLFSSSEGETVSLLTHKFTIRSKWPITAFTQYLESQVRIRKGNLLDVGSSGFSPGAMERLIAAFSDVSSDVSLDVSSDVSSRRLGGECPFCSAESTELIQDLASRALVCSEYISRQQRISKFMRIKDCTHHSQLHINELRGEVDILTNLWKTITVRFIQELSCTFLDISTKLRHFLNGLLKQLGLVVPNLRDFEAHDLHDLYDGKDCFDRLPAHQWLEMLDQDPSNEVWPTISMENINEQDWFGRTVLHISCQKRWHRATRLLLNIGANPGKSTKFSSLPIHYAAANGSKLICGMLLAHQDKFDIHGTDSNGLTAHDYAIRNGCPEVAELLSEYRDIGKEQATPINASANSHS